MLEPTEFPLILSPNLGCPEIVSMDELRDGGMIRLIMAARQGEFAQPLDRMLDGALHLRPLSDPSDEIPLQIMGHPAEIVDWNVLSDLPNVGATRELIASELHYHVLGDQTRYWTIHASITAERLDLLGNRGPKPYPRLFDLVFRGKSCEWEKVNPHAVAIIKSFDGPVKFIHLTDLHVAQRNDEILDEVLKTRCEEGRDHIQACYANFNDKLRQFIRRANDLAAKEKLDFIVITGDLVDFAFPGWDDSRDSSENNWKTFINIITGGGKEKHRGNPGIAVPIFTSTGNHDWRLHPYDPKVYCDSLGLHRPILEHYSYKGFDPDECPESSQAKLARKLTDSAFTDLKIDAFTDSTTRKLQVGLAQVATGITPWISRIAHGAAIAGLGGAGWLTRNVWLFVGGLPVAEGAIRVGKWWVRKKLPTWLGFVLNNPLVAEARALHYYLRHVNPYFDYAFRYGPHHFIVMDTGADVFTGRFLDGKGLRDLKRASVEDNILGGSPDSRAFDSEQKYYNWSQIVWLEKVLASLEQEDDAGRTFVFLHAPPINLPKDLKPIPLHESARPDVKWIDEQECNLTFGTVNHYIPQFFYLCMGYRESEMVGGNVAPSVRKVDMVFSGHAHINIEFRIGKEWNAQDDQHAIRIYCDDYSRIPAPIRDASWWQEHTPLIVQTAACGLCGDGAEHPPYCRLVRIDPKGRIGAFSALDADGTEVRCFDPSGRLAPPSGPWIMRCLRRAWQWWSHLRQGTASDKREGA